MAVLNQASTGTNGQTLYTSGATQADVSAAISAQGLTPVPVAKIPVPPVPGSLNPTLTGAQAIIAANTQALTQAELDAQNAAQGKTQQNSSVSTDMASIFDKYINSLPKPASSTDQYTADYSAAGIDQKTTERNQSKAALGSTIASIQGLTAQAEAEKLAQQNTFGTTGNTIGQQAQIDRNYAIKALPLQVQALAQQAALSNSQDILEQAQQHLDTFFQIHSKDAENEYKYKTNLASAVYEFASKQQQAKLDELKVTRQQAFQTQQDTIQYARTLASTAITNGQPAVASRIMALDPASKTYSTDVAKLAATITLSQSAILDIALKQAQIANTRANTAGTLQKVGATNAANGSVQVVNSAGKKVTILQDTYNERTDTINLVNQALGDKNLKLAVGLQSWNPFNMIPGNTTEGVKAVLKQVNAKLALDNRAKLKGSGAISDFEARTLERSASSFNTNLPYAQAVTALTQIKGALTTANGGTATVLITDSKGQTASALADTAAINKMIADGLTVTYK